MHTVLETSVFIRAAEQAGLSDAEREAVVEYLARNPMAGDEIPGTGGCRKLRFAGRGKGKSGGYRVITFYSGTYLPVVLIDVFSKDERTDLSQAERNDLKRLTKVFVETYRGKAALLTR
ncbi:MAG TPA: type II toxin-antitoxin system RelE/ParE family toxin [Beijerinckiaceae bacterium]|jgi:hypothetical protein